MRWTPGGTSDNIEDQRDNTGGGGGGFSIGGGTGLGLGGTILLLILSFVFKQDFFSLLGGGSHTAAPAAPVTQAEKAQDASEEPVVQFISFVLDDTQKTWRQLLAAQGTQYRDAKLVLFRDSINSACGFAQSATGPFYCPPDQKVYIDLGFFRELRNRFGASGEFAEAYVLAHEIGHHVQNLLGIERKVRQLRQSNPGSGNALSVRVELQADCFAGVWGHTTQRRNLLESGEEEQALNAAAAIGDDRLQRMSTGHVSPESFTHGTSAQRVHWFKQGFDTGNMSACNTFAQ